MNKTKDNLNLNDFKEKLEILIKEQPDNIPALHDLALIYTKERAFKRACTLLEQAISYNPNEASLYNNLGKVQRSMGEIILATASFREALKIKSNYSLAHNNLGACLYQQGLLNDAAWHFQKAISIDATYSDAHLNLANTLVQNNKPFDAVAHYKATLSLDHENQTAIHNLGIVLCNLGQFTEAEHYLSKALNFDKNNPDIDFHLALMQDSQGNSQKAKQLYKKVIEADTNYAMAHHNLATIYLREQNKENALYHYKVAYSLDNENKTAEHLIKSLVGENPAQAPSEYIKLLFDQYASNYNEHLKNKLSYQGPKALREAVTPYLTDLSSSKILLDLGCGTGLCASYFNDIAHKAIGVDISEKMVATAKELPFYSKVFTSELSEFLSKRDDYAPYDIILAADVFVYFGALDKAFNLVANKLKRGGLFAFTVEENTTNKQYQLQDTGRYKHSAEYIEELAKKNKLSLKEKRKLIIRTQNGTGIWALLYIFKL